ncbi:MAG: ABC transporter permease [Acidimicrobiia bacterium]
MTDPASVTDPTTTADAGEPPVEHRSRLRTTVETVLRNRLAVAGLLILAVLILVAIFAHLIAPFEINGVDISNRLMGPSWTHLFGTDELGRDVFSRVVIASRVSLEVGAISVGIALGVGVPVGLIAGYYGGAVDSVLMRIMDVLFSIPAIMLAIAIVASLGSGIVNAMIAIGIVYTPIFARITRGSVLGLKESVFVRAARSVGASDFRILRTHILPNVIAPIIVQTSLSLAFAILAEAALSFLGLGVQPPDPAWGRMLTDGRQFFQQAPWMAFFPGLAIVVTVMSFNFVGDGLRDALDPQQRSVIESRGAGA